MGVATAAETIIVPGRAAPLARYRHPRRGKPYLPKTSQEFRQRVQTSWLVAGRPNFGTVPLVMECEFVGMRSNGDCTNALKAVEDALQGLAFEDDKQVVRVAGSKRRCEPGEEPHCVVELEPWPG